jgi:hypothetical protein
MTAPARNRFVLFTPPAPDKDTVYKSHGNLPFSALITHVWSDRMVNLIVFMPNGDYKPYSSVDLLDGTEDENVLKAHKKAGRYAQWPAIPAAKMQTLEMKVDAGAIAKAVDEAIAKSKAEGAK